MRTDGSLLSQRTKGLSKLPCPLCDLTIPVGSACTRCHAPAEVIRSISAREQPPRFVGVLGPTNVGKTVYLGMLLDLLSRGAGGLHGVARGSFSLELHRNLILALERQRFPAKTPNEPDRWQWVHCEVTAGKKGAQCDIVTPDVAGEVVAAELASPKSHPTVRALIGRCSALVVLVDILQVVSDGQGQELFAMQLISYLDSLRTPRKHAKVDVPVALVFTKADLCEDSISDPEAFARSNAPGLWKLCGARLARYKFFASGVAGSAAKLIDREGRESLVPLRVEPRGIVDPLVWLLG
jgi:double-GTPase-like protein